MYKVLKHHDGFTFVEIIAALIVIGLLSAIAISRAFNYDAEVYAGSDTLKAHLRYAQTMAMNTSESSVWGINCSGDSYWLFKGTNTADIIRLPGDDFYMDADRKINLIQKKIKISSFTVYFDNRGIPYSAFTAINTNTPLSSTMTINVQPLNGTTPDISVNITPFTGYIP